MSEANNAKQLRELIRILERRLGALEDEQITCCGVTMAQCHALVEVGRANNISLNELAELLTLENSTMSRTVNNLVNSDLVNRQIDHQDRRYITISLTESGQKLFNDIEESRNDYYEKILAIIPEHKREQVLESMQLLLEAIGENQGYKCC